MDFQLEMKEKVIRYLALGVHKNDCFPNTLNFLSLVPRTHSKELAKDETLGYTQEKIIKVLKHKYKEFNFYMNHFIDSSLFTNIIIYYNKFLEYIHNKLRNNHATIITFHRVDNTGHAVNIFKYKDDVLKAINNHNMEYVKLG